MNAATGGDAPACERAISPRGELAGVAALVAAALVLRVIWWSRTSAMFADGPRYLAQAARFAAGDVGAALASVDHPLYALLVAALRALVGPAQPAPGDWERLGAAVSIACGTAGVAVLYVLLRRLHGRGVAAIGAVLLAFHVRAVEWSADVQSEALYALALLGGAALLWEALERESARFAAAAGAASGIAYLTRPEGLSVAAVGLALFVLFALRRSLPARRAASLAAALAVGLFVAVAPYVFALHAAHGSWMLTPKKSIATLFGGAVRTLPTPTPAGGMPGATLELPPLGGLPLRVPPAGAGAPPQPTAPTTPAASTAPAPVAPAAPTAPAAPAARSFAVALGDVAVAFISGVRHEVVVFLALGAVVCAGRPGRRGSFVLTFVGLGAVLAISLSYRYGYVSGRHLLPPALLAFGYAAIGLRALGSGLARALRPLAPRFAGAPTAAVVLGLALAASFALPKHLRAHRSNTLAERRAAEWLRSAGPLAARPVTAVAVDRPRIAFYAGAPALDLRHVPADRQLLPVLRAAGVSHVIADPRSDRAHPDLRDLRAVGLPVLRRTRAADREAVVLLLADPAGAATPPAPGR